MQKINFEEMKDSNIKDFNNAISNFEKLLTFEMKNIESKEILIKFQDYLKHGFLFKPGGPLRLKKNYLPIIKNNKDLTFLEKYVKYNMITGYFSSFFLINYE